MLSSQFTSTYLAATKVVAVANWISLCAVLRSLDVEFNLLQHYVLVVKVFVSAYPELNVILCWLRQLLTEPWSSSVTALILSLTPLTIS